MKLQFLCWCQHAEQMQLGCSRIWACWGGKWCRTLQQMLDLRGQNSKNVFTSLMHRLKYEEKGGTHRNPRTASLTGEKGRTWRSDRCVWARLPAPSPSSKSGRTSSYLSSSDIKLAGLLKREQRRWIDEESPRASARAHSLQRSAWGVYLTFLQPIGGRGGRQPANGFPRSPLARVDER